MFFRAHDVIELLFCRPEIPKARYVWNSQLYLMIRPECLSQCSQSLSKAVTTAFSLKGHRILTASSAFRSVHSVPIDTVDKPMKILVRVVQSKLNIEVAADEEVNGTRFLHLGQNSSSPSPSPRCSPPHRGHCEHHRPHHNGGAPFTVNP